MSGPMSAAPRDAGPRWQRFPALPLALTAVLCAFTLFPPVRSNPRLVASFLGTGAVLLAWMLVLCAGVRLWGQRFRIEFARPLKSHYIQASMQLCIYAYWGWYWRKVYAEAPLILGQLVFLYAFDALLTWSRGRAWRLGFGPLPIILSTNVFIWFRDDLYALQFLMVATGALGKEFIRWNRDGKRTHIFNPSAFTLMVFSIALLATGRTDDTWVKEIAATFARPPHIYLVVFLLGLVVQYFFSVTLVTLSAVAMLCVLNLAYLWTAGTYYFVSSNIPAAVFIGLTFLVTDPSTSPRSNAGRIMFGALYGLLSFIGLGILDHYGAPAAYDKLLPIPILNLLVPWIDRRAQAGVVGRFNRWQSAFHARKLNLVHMGCWVALFSVMLGTGYVDAPHEGASVAFWKQASRDGRPDARRGLLRVLRFHADGGSGDAWNQLGLIYAEGQLVGKDPAVSAHCFARAFELGSPDGCKNLVTQYFFTEGPWPGEGVEGALDQLEREANEGLDGRSCFLIGCAYEIGKGRPVDGAAAAVFYEKGCARRDPLACKAMDQLRSRQVPP